MSHTQLADRSIADVLQVTVLIPPPAADAAKSWRKAFYGIDSAQPKGYAILGEWLNAGALYRMPRGLIVGYDRIEAGHLVTVWRVDEDASLTEIASITRKGITWAGPATLKKLATLAKQVPWPGGHAVEVAAAPNPEVSTCRTCWQPVAALAGVQGRNDHGRVIVTHMPGMCPPKPLTPNRYEGRCLACGSWIEAGQGILGITPGGRFGPAHGLTIASCPPECDRYLPVQPNQIAEPCKDCWQIVKPGDGVYDYHTRTVSHSDNCPSYGCAVWTSETVSSQRTPPPRVGQAMRVTALIGDTLLPLDTPGRRLSPTVSAVMVAVAVAKTRYRRPNGIHPYPVGWVNAAAWRPATVAEAVEILAAERAADNRSRLSMQARNLFPDDSALRTTDDAHLSQVLALPGVRSAPVDLGDRLFGRYLAAGGARDHLRVDADNATVWTARFNGGEHDDWAQSNHGRWVLTAHPMTTVRVAALDQLAAEFGSVGHVEVAPDTELTHAVAVFSVLYVPPSRRSLHRPQPPWVAELTGLDPDYHYRRRFLDRGLDYRQASASLESGLQVCWTLESGRIYEAWHRVNRRGLGVREFLTVTVAGDIVTLDEEEVRAWVRRAH